MGLDEHAPGLVAAPGAPRDLLDLLEAALGGAQVAALQPEVGIDHADQREVGEVIALGHQLRADDDVDLARLHRAHELGGARRRPDGVAGDDRGARLGEQRGDLVGDALDPGAAGDEAVLVAALGAQPRRGHDVAAMVAGEAVHQPMLDHPRGAIGALEAMPAGPAQGQRGEAAAVEEQQALLARGEVGGEFGDQLRREPAAARRRVLGQVERGDGRHDRGAVALLEQQFAIAPDLDHVAGLDRRGRRGQDDRDLLEMAAHHRDVAGVILDAFLLLEARLMRFVDDDQPEVGVGQEQRRARADDDLGVARWRSRARRGGAATSAGRSATPRARSRSAR